MGYTEASSAKTIAERLIEAHHPHLGEAVIAYIMKTVPDECEPKPPKGPSRAGRKIKIATTARFSDKNRAAVELIGTSNLAPDFVIEINEPYWDLLTLEQQKAVIDHELCHCTSDADGFYLIDHDVQEFRAVVARHGLYVSDLEEFAASIELRRQMELNFAPSEEDQRVKPDSDRGLTRVANFSPKSASVGN